MSLNFNSFNIGGSNGGGGGVNRWTKGLVSYYTNATLESDTDNNAPLIYEVDLSSLLPDDGAQYEVLFLLACSDGNIIVDSDVSASLGGYIGTSDQRDQLLIPVGAERKIRLVVYRTATGVYLNSVLYRKIG